MAATFRGGSQVAQMDPVVFISAMAAVTQSVAFGVTGSTSYITPYILARTARDPLHIVGKVANGQHSGVHWTTLQMEELLGMLSRHTRIRQLRPWAANKSCPVLSGTPVRDLVLISILQTPLTNSAAHEYMDLTYQMWESSWEDGVQVWQSEPTMAVSAVAIHLITSAKLICKYSMTPAKSTKSTSKANTIPCLHDTRPTPLLNALL